MLRGTVPSSQSSATHSFARSPQANIPRSKFNRSHGHKTTFDEGYLVPILVDEMLPGDTFNLSLHAFARLATPIFPIMDNLYMETFFFFVPNRLVWDNWEKFNGYQVNPGDSTDYVIPQLVAPVSVGVQEGELGDYFGIPTAVASLSFSALPFRAYNLIINEWFRSQDLQNSLTVSTGNGPDTYANYSLVRRTKRYDYFTSCLPFPQKGPDQLIPMATTAPVTGDGANGVFYVGATSHAYGDLKTTSAANPTPFAINNVSGTFNASEVLIPAPYGGVTTLNAPTGYIVDTSTLAGTINELREAFQIQKMYERDARGGTRYTEVIRSHFGVVSPDMRLQRPEYLGGGSTPVQVTPVAQTAQPTTPTDRNYLGHLGGYGTVAPQGHGFTYSATEHGIIIGLVNVRADVNYQSGLERMWSRSTRFDFFWPALQHLGEQAVLNKEIYATNGFDDDHVFGYQERYAEYRYKPSNITGLFRSNASGTLDAWHLAQNFGALPTLGSDFIVENAPMTRIEAVPSDYDFLFDGFFSYHCVRPMSVYAVPGLVDHF